MEKIENLLNEVKYREVAGTVDHLDFGENGIVYIRLRNKSEDPFDKHFSISPEVFKNSGLSPSLIDEDMEVSIDLNNKHKPIRIKRLNIQ